MTVEVQGIFGAFALTRDYYYHEGRKQGHYPTDAALGLETGYTPALARLVCLEGADETGYQKAENHLLETAGIQISARQIQRVAQRVGVDAQRWQQRKWSREPAPPSRFPSCMSARMALGCPCARRSSRGAREKARMEKH